MHSHMMTDGDWSSCPQLEVTLTFRQGDGEIAVKVPRPPRNDPLAKHDALLAHEANGAEGPIKVVVVNVRGDAVLRIIHIHNGCVWLLAPGQDAPPTSAGDQSSNREDTSCRDTA